MPPSIPTVQKVIVAVHGIGDQSHNETIQSVATRFAAHCDTDLRLPLGHFYTADETKVVCHQLEPPPGQPAELANVWFAEVYWADLPRKIVDEKHTLEETKAWARTIVCRLTGHSREERKAIAVVLEEIIETVDTLDKLLLIARFAGLFNFELKGILDDYLGDVQLVTEFEGERNKIMEKFRGVLAAVASVFPDAEIHIVAHSEGTVVAFYGLLEALHKRQPSPVSGDPYGWVEQVRGLMTIGSPINKHLFMWPWLWVDFEAKSPAPTSLGIEWRNYYDYADPIGFELDEARTWLRVNDPNGCFKFTTDIGFARYVIPGKAHNDYWDDAEVFGDFIANVVGIPIKPHRKIPLHRWTRRWVAVVSPCLPYLFAFVLLYAGTLLLVRAVEANLDKPQKQEASK